MYLLFTMSDNPLNPTCAARRRCRLAAKRIFGLDDSPAILFVFGDSSKNRRGKQSQVPELVEPDGIEPTTSCLQSTRSPN